MSRFNKIILIGTVVSPVEVKEVGSGDSVAEFKLEVDRPVTDNAPAQTDTFKIIAWRDLAEKAKTCDSGNMILVEGSIRNRNFENSEGNRIYVTEIEARILKKMNSDSQVQASQDSSQSIPVIEESPKDEKVFDFNQAIKEESPEPELAAQLGEDVPF